MLGTCDRGPGPPQVGPGPPRAYPDPRELSAQLAAWEGSGAATCHAGAGASFPLEAPSPTRIKVRVVEAGSAASRHGAVFVSLHCVSPVTEAARQLRRQALKTQRRAHGRRVMMTSY